jgi:anti-sigma factor RsiW
VKVNDTCHRLHFFVDGELSDGEHRDFRDHLVSCSFCPEEMSAIFALKALAESWAVTASGRAIVAPASLMIVYPRSSSSSATAIASASCSAAVRRPRARR